MGVQKKSLYHIGTPRSVTTTITPHRQAGTLELSIGLDEAVSRIQSTRDYSTLSTEQLTDLAATLRRALAMSESEIACRGSGSLAPHPPPRATATATAAAATAAAAPPQLGPVQAQIIPMPRPPTADPAQPAERLSSLRPEQPAWDDNISDDFKRVLRFTVSEATYQAATGPQTPDRGRVHAFSALQICMALVHVGVASLYPQQIVCLVSLFTARHVFCVMQTGFGKTFAYEGLVLLYDFVYNGDHRSKDYVRHFPFCLSSIRCAVS